MAEKLELVKLGNELTQVENNLSYWENAQLDGRRKSAKSQAKVAKEITANADRRQEIFNEIQDIENAIAKRELDAKVAAEAEIARQEREAKTIAETKVEAPIIAALEQAEVLARISEAQKSVKNFSDIVGRYKNFSEIKKAEYDTKLAQAKEDLKTALSYKIEEKNVGDSKRSAVPIVQDLEYVKKVAEIKAEIAKAQIEKNRANKVLGQSKTAAAIATSKARDVDAEKALKLAKDKLDALENKKPPVTFERPTDGKHTFIAKYDKDTKTKSTEILAPGTYHISATRITRNEEGKILSRTPVSYTRKLDRESSPLSVMKSIADNQIVPMQGNADDISDSDPSFDECCDS